MRDLIDLIAGFAILAAMCYGMFFWCCLAFTVWFAHYMLVGHWQQKREQREREARRAAYKAQQDKEAARQAVIRAVLGANPNAQS